jgi:hypothetical protein
VPGALRVAALFNVRTESMKQIECMYAWTPGTDQIAVGPWPDVTGWSDRYDYTGGACYAEVHKMTSVGQERRLFIDFNTVVVRDGVPVKAAHNAFLQINEYRALISPNTEGADI